MTDMLTQAEREAALAGLDGWIYDPAAGAIRRDLRFPGFSEAFAFMTRVALMAERADHHPELWNAYGRVRITLSTHSAGGLTRKDTDMAARIDGLLQAADVPTGKKILAGRSDRHRPCNDVLSIGSKWRVFSPAAGSDSSAKAC